MHSSYWCYCISIDKSLYTVICLCPASGDFLAAKNKILRETLTSQSKIITILEFS